MKKTALIFICASFLFFGLTVKAQAAIYYVDNCVVTGNDSSNGTDPTTPWLTINKVNTSSFVAGDSISFRKGCTWREQLTSPSSGSVGNPVTFNSYGASGAKPVISGSDLVTGWSASPTGGDTGGLFIADAETGNASQFTATTTGGTATFNVDTTSKLDGTYGFHTVSDGTNNTYGYKTFSSQTDMYLRFYVRVKSGYNTPGTFQHQQIADLKDVGNNTSIRATIYEQSEGHYYIFVNMPWGGFVGGTSVEIATDTWNRVEFHFKVDGSVGGGEAWLNGTSIFSNFTLNTTGKSPVRSEVGLINAVNVSNAGSEVYFDDIKASATGPIGAYPNAPASVFQAAAAWTPYVVSQGGTRLTKVASEALITSAGKWYSDGATLYVRTTGSDDPTPYSMEVGKRLYSVDLDGKTYNTVDGFTLSGANENGAVMMNGANFATISNNTIKNIGHFDWGAGIHFKGTTNSLAYNNDVSNAYEGVTVEGWYSPLSNNNTIRANTIHDVDATGAIATKGSVGQPAGTIFEYNNVYNCVLLLDDNPGIGTYYGGTGTIIRYNSVHNCGSSTARGSGINIDSHSEATQVYGNLVYLNNYGGINLTASGHSVYNNTLYHNDEGTADAGEISIFTQDALAGSSMTIKNNILVASAGKHILVAGSGNTTGHVIDYNDYFGGSATPFNWAGTDYNFANYKTTSSQDANSTTTDPKFTTAGSDFSLLSTSPAIDTGFNLGSTYKLGLNPNSVWPSGVNTLDQTLNGPGWEMGAYVYSQSSAPTVSVTTPSASAVLTGPSVTLSANASATSPATISSVQFKVDGANVGTADTTSPYSITWDSTSIADGAHSITALALDNYGNSATSTPISVTVHNNSPIESSGLPVSLPVNTTSATLSLVTDEVATCKYSTSAGTSFASMTPFSSSNSTTHSTPITGLSNGNTYTYYVKCADTLNNTNTVDYIISFIVAVPQGSGGLITNVPAPSSSGGHPIPVITPTPIFIVSVILGCDNRTTGFSTTTGKSCSTNIAKVVIPDCNGTNGFSTSTGQSCSTNAGGVTSNPSTQVIYNLGTVTLRNGSTGNAVTELQKFLNKFLNLNLTLDGKLGPKTVAGIKEWQTLHNLVADGVVGPLTKAKMNASATN